MALTFKIDGTEYVHFIKHKGLKWSRNDIDDGAERVIADAQMQRNRVATKSKLQIQLKLIKDADLASICSAIEPEYIQVTYLKPSTNTVVTEEFYGTTINTAVASEINGVVYYGGCSFNLVER